MNTNQKTMNTNKKTLIIITFCLLLTIIISASKAEMVFQNNVSDSNILATTNEMLSYKLAVFWPKGYCKEDKRKACNNVELPNSFTIHGLWVIDRSKVKPTPSTQKFDKTLLEDIRSNMDKYWPDIMDYGDNSNTAKERHVKATLLFWEKEWNKHGKIDPIFKDRFHDYYLHTLNLFISLHLTNVIINLSGGPNTPQLMRDALSSHHRSKPHLLCTKDKNTGIVYLSEIQFCLDATAQAFVDCIPKTPPSLDIRDCREGQTFFY